MPEYADLLGYPVRPLGRVLYLAMDRPRAQLLAAAGLRVPSAMPDVRLRTGAGMSAPRMTFAEAVRGDAPVRVTVSGDPVAVAAALRELVMAWPIADTVPDDLAPDVAARELNAVALVSRLILVLAAIGPLPWRVHEAIDRLRREIHYVIRPCSTCGAEAGRWCTTLRQGRSTRPHAARRRIAP